MYTGSSPVCSCVGKPACTSSPKGALGRAWAPSGGTAVAASRSELRSFVLRCCRDVAVDTDNADDDENVLGKVGHCGDVNDDSGREDVIEMSLRHCCCWQDFLPLQGLYRT